MRAAAILIRRQVEPAGEQEPVVRLDDRGYLIRCEFAVDESWLAARLLDRFAVGRPMVAHRHFIDTDGDRDLRLHRMADSTPQGTDLYRESVVGQAWLAKKNG